MEGSGDGFLSRPSDGRLLHLGSSIHGPKRKMNLMGGAENDDSGSVPKWFSVNLAKANLVDGFDDEHAGEEEEEDHTHTEDGYAKNPDLSKSKEGNPWKRMKWTDDGVRLLISIVAFIDEDGMEDCGAVIPKRKKFGCLQKEGKWKTIAKIMISKGFHVSPQQCEDKFNDLNKRYKKLDDIIGLGTSCRVVENPNLLDSFPHLSAKAKEEVKKILSSKHFFYEEMCSYHNFQSLPSCCNIDLGRSFAALVKSSTENKELYQESDGNESSDVNNDDDDDDDDSDFEYEDDDDESKRENRYDDFRAEMDKVFQNPGKPQWELKEWIKKQTLNLSKQRLNIQARAFGIERQRLKWLRYCTKKEIEMEKLRMEKERLKVENDRSILRLRKAELEMELRRAGVHLDLIAHHE